MTAQRTLDVSHLPPYAISNQAPLWWGQLFLAFVECTMFLILVAMYFYIRLSVDIWPPPGIQLPHLTWPNIALALMLVSCLGSYWASEAAKKNDRLGMIGGLLFNLVIGSAAMIARGIEWYTWNYKWSVNAYGSITWGILFLHTFDAVADLVFTLVLIVILLIGNYGPKQRQGVHVDSVIWYFVVGIWIPLYAAVYLGPYLVGAP